MLILLSGYSGSGKSTIANMLVEWHGFSEVSLAQAIKVGLSKTSGLALAEIESAKNNEASSVRTALQAIGQAACEKDPYHWCKRVKESIEVLPISNNIGDGGVVVPDLRKVYELDYFKSNFTDVWHIHVTRTGLDLSLPKYQHISESAVEELSMLADRVIVNNSSLNALVIKVDFIYKKIRGIERCK